MKKVTNDLSVTFDEQEVEQIRKLKNDLNLRFSAQLSGMPSNLYAVIRQCGILTGGAVSSVYHNTSVSDWDVYLTSEQAMHEFNQLVQHDVVVKSMIQDVTKEYRSSIGKDGKLITENAVTFKNNVQVITRSLADEARKTFDFIHCMPYYDLKNHMFYISKKQFTSIKDKVIYINSNTKSTFENSRALKYIKRGWKLNNEQK